MTTLTNEVPWNEGAKIEFVVAVRRKADGTRVDLTGASIALEVRDKPVTSGGTLHLRADNGDEGGIEILDPDEGETDAHRMMVTLPDTSGETWTRGIAEIRVLFPGDTLPTPVLRFPVTMTRKIVDAVAS